MKYRRPLLWWLSFKWVIALDESQSFQINEQMNWTMIASFYFIMDHWIDYAVDVFCPDEKIVNSVAFVRWAEIITFWPVCKLFKSRMKMSKSINLTIIFYKCIYIVSFKKMDPPIFWFLILILNKYISCRMSNIKITTQNDRFPILLKQFYIFIKVIIPKFNSII